MPTLTAGGINHRLFALIGAPADLHGATLAIAVILAQWAILLAPCGLALLWFVGDHDDRRAAVSAALTGGIALAAAAVLSWLIVTPRPFMDGPARNYLDHARDSSFPSDHATLLFAIAFAFWTFRPRRLRWLWAPGLVLALAVGWARVFLDAHYPLDIAGGALVAAVCAALTAMPRGRRVAALVSTWGDQVWDVLVGRFHRKGRKST